MKLKQTLILTLLLWAGAMQIQSTEPPPVPLPRAHAHNDYEHKRPLLDALDHGFCGVEADVYLVGGQLLVAHDRDKVSPDRTLQRLYLDPLRERVQRNDGRVYRGGPVVTLLIDIKSDAADTYVALREVLKRYADMLCAFSSGRMETKAVLVIISGNRPRQVMEAESVRYAAYDGRLADLDGKASREFIPLISDNWNLAFRWRGTNMFPEAERRKLREIVAKAHAQGRKVRFWAAPDRKAVWQALLDAGVDLINTDDLAGLREFLVSSRVTHSP
jgi:glycerophosphoryl diester phosphodiesterase